MDKKKAIKLATASAVAASAFVAANPNASEAATNVASVVSQAKAQFKNAYYAYSQVTSTGKFADINTVYAEYKKAKKAYADAVALVKKAGGANKDALLADLDATYNEYVAKRVVTYIDAYNYAVKLDALRKDLQAAVDAKDLAKAEDLYNKISYELKKRTVILDRVYGQTTRDLLRSQFKAAAQQLRDSLVYDITVSVKLKAAEEATNKGDLTAADAALKAAQDALAKATAFKTELTAKQATVKAAYEAKVTPKVESVSAINAKQIEIKFNTKMDKDSVTDVTKYSIKRAGVTATQLSNVSSANEYASAELSEDGKTLTITFKNALTSSYWGSIAEGDTFNFELGKLKAANGKEIEAQSVAVKYSDKVAPTFVSASASGKTATTQIKVTFNEPVDTSVATATIDGTVASVTVGSKPNEVIITSGSNLLVGKTYKLSLLNVKDVAGNLVSPNPVTFDVTVASDTTAPTVTSVKAVRDNLIEVTFDKSMDASTISASSIRVLDANLNSTGITQGTVTAKAYTDNKTFLVPLTAVPFNSSGVFTGVISVANTVKDAAGNAINAVTQNITLTKDTTAPQVVSVTYKKVTSYNGIATTYGAIVVKFNESISASAAASRYVVVDDQGRSVSTPIASRQVNPNDNTELVLVLNAAVASDVKTYTVVMPNSAVTDLSLGANASASANLAVDVSSGAPVPSDTTAPTVASVSATPATSTTSGTIIVVNFTETGSGLDASTVTNINNYRLDGMPLPAGSYVTTSGTTVTINIPAGSISKDKTYSLNINGIKDKAGNTMSPVVQTVTLRDDIKPVLTSATLNTNGTLSLGFSEAVRTVTTGTAVDFVITANGTDLVPVGAAPSVVTFVDGVGSELGKYVITVTGRVDAGVDGNAGTTADNRVYIDLNGNDSYDTNTDVLVKTGTTASVGATTIDLNDLASLKVRVISSPTTVTDTSALTNALKGDTTIIVK
ncbi:Ig-like domain-containing protein [Anoxybacillus sp. J5B_2022]|uniref:Ig-like domain-containing protein n=1 Tax=Anoxybacillus sp. J5B_2022 TaxID=3003246 RepID=UPI002285BB85|nr:Ig-like domain-containing protein [Anoxybacillus sp. J5B_2022]MCZ0756656.1 Ig-like domain-containing protein [Anoxybacillus sp. J5B_2022]